MSAEVWLRLQARYDLEMAEAKLGDRITHEVKVCERAAPYTVESSDTTMIAGGGACSTASSVVGSSYARAAS